MTEIALSHPATSPLRDQPWRGQRRQSATFLDLVLRALSMERASGTRAPMPPGERYEGDPRDVRGRPRQDRRRALTTATATTMRTIATVRERVTAAVILGSVPRLGSPAAQREPHQPVGRTGDARRASRRPRPRPRASASPTSPSRSPTRTYPCSCARATIARTSAGPSASSVAGPPEGQRDDEQPAGPQRPRGLAQGLVDVRGVAAAGMDPGHDVDRAHVDVQQVVPAAHHGQPQVHGREPARARPPAQRRRRTRLVDDQRGPPALVTLARYPVGHPDHGGERAQGGPRSDAVASPGQSECPGRRLGLVGLPAVLEDVGRTHPLGQVATGQLDARRPGRGDATGGRDRPSR